MKNFWGTLLYYSLIAVTAIVVIYAWAITVVAPMLLRNFGLEIVDNMSHEEKLFLAKSIVFLAYTIVIPMGIILLCWIIAFYVQSRRLKSILSPENKKWPW
jgi:hypothetical protein